MGNDSTVKISSFRPSAAGDLTVSLPDGLTTLDGIQLQLTSTNLVCPNVQISGIDPSNINNITLQVPKHGFSRKGDFLRTVLPFTEQGRQ